MIQEDKELLIKDLCARLSYGVKVLFENKVFSIDYISGIYKEIKLDNSDRYTLGISEVKPYLFPLSSMTKEQQTNLTKFVANGIHGENILYDWYNKNHFDYRGLIEKGLAIDATGLNIY